MPDFYEVFERFAIMTVEGMSDKDALEIVRKKYGEKWVNPIKWKIYLEQKQGAEKCKD